MTISLSIGIPTYQRGDILCQTLGPLLERCTASVKEVIIADQCPNHSAAIQAKLKRMCEHPLVHYLALESSGLTFARNRILAEAQGEGVIFLDDDVAVSEEMFERYAEAFERTGADAILGQVYQSNSQMMTDSLATHPLCPTGSSCFGNQGTWVSCPRYAMGCNHAVLRQPALSIGGYDEHFCAVAKNEECDFLMRLALAGGSIWYEPSCWLVHFSASTGGVRQNSLPIREEWTRSYNDLLWLIRLGRASGTFKTSLWRALRRGPLHKRNVLRPWRQPWAWASFLYALLRAAFHSPIVLGIDHSGTGIHIPWRSIHLASVDHS